jgi:glycosyltransferase involved in cell wall biosynthesis
MRILEVHYSTAWAGAERIVVDLCNELSINHTVYLCTIVDDTLPGKSYYKAELSPSVRYINLKCRSGMDIKGFVRLYKTIKTIKPDVVHAHTDALNLWIPSLLYTKPKYFHTIHNLAQKRQYKSWLTPIYCYFYKHRIQAITISNICKQSYIELYHLNNAIQIDNGRTQMMPSPNLKHVEEEIRNYRKTNQTKIFVHVARCSEQKNEPLLFKTFCRLYNERKDAVLLVIGANYDAPENKYLLETATPNIHWLGLKNNVCDYLLNSDFFILSSKWEGLPISLLEAISTGIIPICTPAGGIPDVIKDRSCGYLSLSMNEEDFYKTVIDALQTSEDFNRERLIEYFQDNFSMKHCANQYIQAFQAEI